jgi:hypothetical protein
VASNEDDIQKVRKAEQRRGSRRRPLDQTKLEERRKCLADLRNIYQNGTLEELKSTMLQAGLTPTSPEWAETLKIWRALN